jgi:hypothetical protein
MFDLSHIVKVYEGKRLEAWRGGLKNHECNTSLNKYWQLQYYNKKILHLIQLFQAMDNLNLWQNAC